MTEEFFTMVFPATNGCDPELDPPEYWSEFVDNDARRDIAFKACQLALSATGTFWGMHYVEWPFFGFSEFAYLPWENDYSMSERGLSRLQRDKLIKDEMRQIAFELVMVSSSGGNADGLRETFGAVWLSPKLMASKKLAVQGLAVQALFCADAALKMLFRDQIADSAVWLASAYENIILMHIECESLLNGRQKGGISRHRNDPKAGDKELVKACWESWECTPNKYPSVEEFARDMLDKTEHLAGNTQVIARWVRGWKKDVASSVTTKLPKT